MKRKLPVVVTGPESVGKTSIIMRYCNNVFHRTYLPTLCSDLCTKTVVDADGNPVELHVWDIGGQEQYKVDRERYLERAYVVIVVIDVSDITTFMSLDDWMRDVKKHAPKGTRTVAVANKIDLRSSIEHCVSFSQFHEEARKLGFDAIMESSALSGENVREIFDTVVALCDGRASCVAPAFIEERRAR